MEEVVIEALFNGDREAQIHAANEISNISSRKRQNFFEKGVMVPLISMLCSNDYDAIEAALNTLLCFAIGSDRNKIKITKSGAIPVLLNLLLQCRNMELQELTMASLLILSSCTANKLTIASSGSIQILVNFINECSIINSHDEEDDINNGGTGNYYITLQTKLDAIATLLNLSTSNQIIPLIISSKIIPPLIKIISFSEKSSLLVEKSMGLIQNLVSSSEIALQETSSIEIAIRALIETIEEGSIQSKEDAVTVLYLICQSCREKYRGLILEEGAMPCLLQMSVDGTWKAKEIAQDLLLMLRDCSKKNRSKKELQNELMMERLMEEIDGKGGERVVRKTLRLVQVMISNLKS